MFEKNCYYYNFRNHFVIKVVEIYPDYIEYRFVDEVTHELDGKVWSSCLNQISFSDYRYWRP